ncbi:MAG: hypothetical protein ACXADY_13525 [Candidatus Hodarchaeales archaeon]|jgi:hypothetical protein
MKKIQKNLAILIITFINLQFLLIPGIANDDAAFVNSFWNTLDFGGEDVLNAWLEAGKIDFSLLDFSATLYIKNDFDSFYLGIRIRENITDDMTWRVNFDVDADGKWAEDAKSLTLKVELDSVYYNDEYYIQNHAQSFPDSQSDDFIASMRTFTSVGIVNTIFQLKIPFQTNDYLHDLQVQSPETTIIGLSIDAFYIDTGLNGTWRGNSYPDYANASNYIQILFAGPQDRQIPEFAEQEEPDISETTFDPRERYPEDYASAGSFEVWIAFLGILATTSIFSNFRRRKKE